MDLEINGSILKGNKTLWQIREQKHPYLDTRNTERDACDQSSFLLLTKWASPVIEDLWRKFIRNREHHVAELARGARRSLQGQVDADVRARLRAPPGATQPPAARLYALVVDLFAEGLAGEARAAAGNCKSLGGLFAKWAPTRGGMHDKATRICEGIAERLDAMGVLETLDSPGDSDSGRFQVVHETEGEGRGDGGGEDRGGRLEGKAAELGARKEGGCEVGRQGDGRGEAGWGAGLVPDVTRAESWRMSALSRLLSALRGKAKVPEHFVGKGAWDQVDYNRMASRCRLLYGRSVFEKHDGERYRAFLAECRAAAAEGRAKGPSIKTGALLPYEVTSNSEAVEASGQTNATLLESMRGEVELQWRGLVQACAQARAGRPGGGPGMSLVPVCDVSGSMCCQVVPRGPEAIDVAVSLALLLAESAPRGSPWFGKVFTFSELPDLVEVPGIPREEGTAGAAGRRAGEGDGPLPLSERARFVKGMDWGLNTDVEAVFDLLLARLKSGGVSAEEVRTLGVVVLTDMEFDCAPVEHRRWETAHESIKGKFERAGYPLPLLIYWNLRDSRSVPIANGDTPGVVMIGGYSAGLLRSLASGRLDPAELDPVQHVREVVAKELYDSLRVADADRAGGVGSAGETGSSSGATTEGRQAEGGRGLGEAPEMAGDA